MPERIDPEAREPKNKTTVFMGSAADPTVSRFYYEPPALDPTARLYVTEMQSTQDATLWSLIKSKFGGYFRWTVFAMVLTPLAFWIFSH